MIFRTSSILAIVAAYSSIVVVCSSIFCCILPISLSRSSSFCSRVINFACCSSSWALTLPDQLSAFFLVVGDGSRRYKCTKSNHICPPVLGQEVYA